MIFLDVAPQKVFDADLVLQRDMIISCSLFELQTACLIIIIIIIIIIITISYSLQKKEYFDKHNYTSYGLV